DKEVLNLFLQLLDDGRLTENTGRTVHFNNTIIIATSNAGTNEITALLQKGLSVDELPRQVMQVLQQSFRPEFLNRFDSVIPFHPLTEQEIQEVAAMMLRSVTAKLSEQGYAVSFEPAAILKIGKMGYDPVFGARPLRRVIQEKVEGLLAELILKKELSPGETLQITAEMIQ
ncbi:MAG: clpB, partial [Patescibacteria group bacterium]|nr:clpB [Patescibacteria group bacterium]